MSHSTWGKSKAKMPTIWDADWDNYSIAEIVISLSFTLVYVVSSRYLIVTTTS